MWFFPPFKICGPAEPPLSPGLKFVWGLANQQESAYTNFRAERQRRLRRPQRQFISHFLNCLWFPLICHLIEICRSKMQNM